MRTDFLWQHFEGRDHDGERFSREVLIHGSGRILAKVYHPLSRDGSDYLCAFFAGGKDLRADSDQRFVDLDSAKRHCETMLADYGSGPKVESTVRPDVAKARRWFESIFRR